MDIWNNSISPLGYQTGGGGIDSYGVNHSGFSTRDELAYQFARQQRENQIIQNYNNQGIMDNYPQYTTNFWGNNAANNYGFGSSNIEANIANLPQATPILRQPVQPQQQNNVLSNNPVAQQNSLQQFVGALGDMVSNYIDMKRDNTIGGDDYFHCKANYEATQRGPIGEKVAEKLGNAKENFDFWDNQLRKGLSLTAAYQDKIHDKTINQIGRQQAKSGLYKSSKEACYPYRVEGINEKY